MGKEIEMGSPEPYVGFDPLWVVSGLLFIPYLVWGVVLLRQHLGDRQDLNPMIEIGTLTALLVFYVLQYLLIRSWLSPTPLKFLVAMAGLFVSGVALYGHLVTSLASRFVVELVMPAGTFHLHEPRYGPGEACERIGNYEGAVREYLAVSRMFPRDPISPLRAADNFIKLGNPATAVHQFERALKNMNSSDKSLAVTLRLAEIYARDLNRPEDATRVLEDYLRRFPSSEQADSVRARLERLTGGKQEG